MIVQSLIASNPFFEAYQLSDLFGKGVFLSLLFLSILSWVIFIRKIKTIRGMRKRSFQFQIHFEKKAQNPLDIEGPSSQLRPSLSNPFFELYLVLKKYTLEILNKNSSINQKSDESPVYLSASDIDLVSSHLTTQVSSKTKELEGHLFILSTVVTLGPFLGLLGTVWGILTTFSQMNAKASGQTNEMILSGLATALGTTVLGLLVAIPAVVAYNYLKNANKEFQIEMEDFATSLLANVEFQYRKVDID